MKRDEIGHAVVALAEQALQGDEPTLAALLYFVAGTIVEGAERQIVEILKLRYEAQERIRKAGG